MAFKRTAIPFFELANAAYVSATVSFFAVDPTTLARLTTLVTLYSAKTGTSTVPNPNTLDTEGKFTVPTYAEERFIAVVTSTDGEQHETGIWEPALSDADVLAAAASATAAAVSQSSAAASATTASAYATAAGACAAAALAAVGTVYASPTDVSLGRLSQKLTATAPLTLTAVAGVLRADISNGTEGAVGAVRFATAAEAAAGAITTAALTPAGFLSAIGNTLTLVNVLAGIGYTAVTNAASVTMADTTRYRFTATAAATVKFPTTLTASKITIVEFAGTVGQIMTVDPNGNYLDGLTSVDTCTAFGPVVAYIATSPTALRSIYIGTIPT